MKEKRKNIEIYLENESNNLKGINKKEGNEWLENLEKERERLKNLKSAYIDILTVLEYRTKKLKYEMLLNAFNFVEKYYFWYAKDQLLCDTIEKSENEIKEYMNQTKYIFSKFKI